MVAEIDFYRSANILVKTYGENAALEAAMRSDARLEAGDTGGAWFWRQVIRAIEKLQSSERSIDEPLQ